MALRRQNAKGQFTKEMSILITKKLQAIADDAEVRVKAIVRDKLEEEYKYQLRATYAPISKTGKAVAEYNDEHTHKKPQSYHHTGLLADSVKALIDGPTVKVEIEDRMYDDGASTTQVYEWLKHGTTKTPANDSYPYVKKQGDNYSTGWASYNPTPKHPFEQHTLNAMEGFLDNLMVELADENLQAKYYKKYLKGGVK